MITAREAIADRIKRLEESVARLDTAPKSEVDRDEYQRLLAELVELREQRDKERS